MINPSTEIGHAQADPHTHGVFAKYAHRLFDNGFQPIPLEGKRPAIKNWQKRLSSASLDRLTHEFTDANVGVLTGDVLALDIDIDDRNQANEIAACAAHYIGFTDFVRIGRAPRSMLLYRSAEQMRKRRAGDVEVLGFGQQIAVLGTHPDTHKSYAWPLECIVDVQLDALPIALPTDINQFLSEASRIQKTGKRPAAVYGPTPQIGERNDFLFDEARKFAAAASSLSEVTQFSHDINADFPNPLPDNEVDKTATSVWKYKQKGRLLIKGKQSIILPIGKGEAVAMAKHPEMLALFTVLRATRSGPTFTIPQQATAQRLGWGTDRLRNAIGLLVETGHLEKVGEAKRGRGPLPAKLYRFRNYTPPTVS